MRFNKEHKEFVALVTGWARSQGWQFHRVDLGKIGVSFHVIGDTCGVIMGRAGRRDKEALYNVSLEIHQRFEHVMAVILPGDRAVLGTDIVPKELT